jgi:RNA polymerase sigma-70 factor (ECF subfamily)
MATVNTHVLRNGIARELRRTAAAPRVRELASCSDNELLAALARREEAALGELYDRFAGIAYGLASRIVRDRSLAEDVVQEAFMSVWQAAGSFDSRRGAARSWLLMIVHRRAVDVVHRNERARARDDRERARTPRQDGRSASEAAELDGERRTVQAALASLSRRQRRVLELAYYGGYTQQEIARRLGLPIGTVKSQTSEALRRLRNILAAAGQ